MCFTLRLHTSAAPPRGGLTQALGAMTDSRVITGIEFDWFATDRDGHIALFATAGSGPTPASVLALVEAHAFVGDSVEIEGWGTKSVWESYARVGLYAYDWSDSQGLYVRQAEPAAPLANNVATAVASIRNVPRLASLFSQATAIAPDWQDGT